MSSTVKIVLPASQLHKKQYGAVVQRVFRVSQEHCQAVAARGENLTVVASSGQVIAFLIARDQAGFVNTFKELEMEFVHLGAGKERFPSEVHVYNPNNRTDETYL